MPRDRPTAPNAPTALPFLPTTRTLPSLRAAAAECRGCDLWERGTQTVFGEGDEHSQLILIGEQPGDSEDRAGRPFIGPAGRLLDRSLEDAGLDRSMIYVTNAVKHFKWEPRGKRRIHSKPNAPQIRACKPWLEAEIETIKPRALLCLGATAAQSLFGSTFKVTEKRGVIFASPHAAITMATVHPSSLLRAPDEETRRVETARFVEDLKVLAQAMTA